ncbi:MAG: hypothetical protein ACO22M_07380 [Candidatus Nanopelagicaceae bacterium]
MEIALIHNNSLELGPFGMNVHYINQELEELEVEERVSPQSFSNLPIHFSDGLTHLLPTERVIPENDPKYQNVGNFTWEIVTEDDVPVKVVFTHPIIDKTLEEVKATRKQEVAPARRQKENTIITLTVNGTDVKVTTSREERLMLASKLSASPGPHNFKFQNTWLEITTEELQYIVSEVDKVVQEAFDWELAKLQEIDACETIDEVYDVVIVEQPELPKTPQLPVE